MRTWLTYLSASILGIATAYFFGGSMEALDVLSSLNSFLLNLALCLTLLTLPFTFMAGVASLCRERKGKKVFLTCLSWSFLSAFLLAFLGALYSWLRPVPFPVTGTSSLSPGTMSDSVWKILSNALGSLSLFNPLWTAGTTMNFFLPLLLVLAVAGTAAGGRQEELRPAYTVLESFSAVMRNVSRSLTIFGFPLAFTSSAVFFLEMQDESITGFTASLALAVLVMLLAVLPLTYALFTRFKSNPYKVMLRSLPVLLLSLFSSDRNMSLSIETTLSTEAIGNDKSISGTATPVMLVLGKGGSAFVSVAVVLSVIYATAGIMLDPAGLFLTALAAACTSFLSSSAQGAEPALITVLVLNFLGLELYGAENALIAILPLVAGLGSLLDCYIAMLGTSAAAQRLGSVYVIGYEDIL